MRNFGEILYTPYFVITEAPRFVKKRCKGILSRDLDVCFRCQSIDLMFLHLQYGAWSFAFKISLKVYFFKIFSAKVNLLHQDATIEKFDTKTKVNK
jgi:hypothetical protein